MAVPDTLVEKAGEAVLGSASGDPLISYMFFTITVLLGAIGVLYWRNQKQNDDTMQIVKDGMELTRQATSTMAVLSERIQNAVNIIAQKD